jgi:hypothetical protein
MAWCLLDPSILPRGPRPATGGVRPITGAR